MERTVTRAAIAILVALAATFALLAASSVDADAKMRHDTEITHSHIR